MIKDTYVVQKLAQIADHDLMGFNFLIVLAYEYKIDVQIIIQKRFEVLRDHVRVFTVEYLNEIRFYHFPVFF